jgi:hypothetical protein
MDARAFFLVALSALTVPLHAGTENSIIVQGQRDSEQLKRDVNMYASSAIMRPFNDDSLLRWDHKICPLVAGMSKEAGEFALARLSQIARDAHAPLGAENCKPNFFVIFAKYPEQFLRLWWRKNPRLFNTHFGIVPAKRFIETSRPVRVWYNADFRSADQGSALAGLLASSTQLAGGMADYPVFTQPSQLGSRLTTAVVRDIGSAIVVVDVGQVAELNIGQLIDYIGLVGLAEINLDKNVGEAPSILKVFASAEAPNPVAMTDWDKALLYSLYTTEQKSRLQLSSMETSIFKQLTRNMP